MAKSILIAYYTHSGNTRHVAEQIQAQTGGRLIQIEPVSAYPQQYNAVVAQAKKEIQQNHRPPIQRPVEHPSAYDEIFIGTPNWWSTMAPPVATFLAEAGLSGKNVMPFITHGGGGAARAAEDIKALCPEATVAEPLVIYGNGDGSLPRKIEDWIASLGI